MVESQLQQIVVLQKEVEVARHTGSSVAVGGQSISITHGTKGTSSVSPTKVEVQGKEVENLKFELREQRAANEELISERRNLMDLIEKAEQQSRENHRQMEKALDKVTL